MSTLIGIYLQDHHAGATGGLALAQRAARSNQGTAYGEELQRIAIEIEQDVHDLERIMGEQGVGPDRRKDGAAWIGEKLGRLKRNGSWLAYSPLSRVVELESLLVGVTGKLALWEALVSVSDGSSEEFENLAVRARDQRRRLEALRRRAAAEAFA